MFVDASALVAVLMSEQEGPGLAERLAEASHALTSPLAVYEASMASARTGGVSVDEARSEVLALLQRFRINVVSISVADGLAALDAHARFGKGRHPAKLNMGDCFAYACARSHGVPLLYKGDDFALTDIQPA